MIVKIAKESGFCFGVKRAMDMAWESLENKNSIYALGPLIHNKQAVSKYEENFILKGALLLSALLGINNRTTRDMDTTIKGIDISKEQMVKVLNELKQ